MDILELSGGDATHMGEGVFMILQPDPDDGSMHHVVLTREDVEALYAIL